MSSDLAIGIFAIIWLSVSAYQVGRHIGLRSAQRRQLCFLFSLTLALAFAWVAAGKLAWASWVPTASVVLWSNLMPVLLSLTAGFASTIGLRKWHSRPAAVFGLVLLTAGYTLLPFVRPILAPAQTTAVAIWKDEVCLQSHDSTCAPAAAATLLRASGVIATENLLVGPCLTSRFGTEPLGLFRGLAIASKKSRRKPVVASSDPSLWTQGNELPNVSLVQFPAATPAVSTTASGTGVFGSLWSMTQSCSTRLLGKSFLGDRAEGHAVVILGRDPRGNWLVADPAFGRTLWSDETFHERFTGDAICLASREQ